jgi:aryl-alcohol dehydrogenase-like predicted oxidoreductase
VETVLTSRGETAESLYPLARQGRLVFGCARLHHLHRPARRERLLRLAIDGGITHFDVAPAYGNGLAERALGDVLRGIGRLAQVNTKVGIPIWVYPALGDRVFPVFRVADALSGSYRRSYASRDFRPVELRRSIEASLRRLGIDAVDTYFLHEPLCPFSDEQWAEIADTMGRIVSAGKARSWGIAGPGSRYGLDKLTNPIPPVLQQPLTEFEEPVSSSARRRLAYGTYSAYRRARFTTGYETFLRQKADRHPEATFLVATCDERRLRGWLAEKSA